MRCILQLVILGAILGIWSCSGSAEKSAGNESVQQKSSLAVLNDSLENIVGEYPGEIGIALITDSGDTVVVNNDDVYPLMSVFKLHQAISLCNMFDRCGTSLDTVVEIRRGALNPDTWSPMLKDYSGASINISVRELLRYTLMQSDNNASNWLFENMESVQRTDSFTATLVPRESFRLSVTEAEMWSEHSRCARNHTSPLGAAILMNRLFTDSIIGQENRDFICSTLRECRTGTDRIVAPLAGKEGVTVAHKTGSGFRDSNGILAAHNDVAFVTLPGGRSYSLAVFVRNFNGTEAQASEAIARVSETVYSQLVGGF